MGLCVPGHKYLSGGSLPVSQQESVPTLGHCVSMESRQGPTRERASEGTSVRTVRLRASAIDRVWRTGCGLVAGAWSPPLAVLP